jgi:hypothetical protein
MDGSNGTLWAGCGMRRWVVLQGGPGFPMRDGFVCVEGKVRGCEVVRAETGDVKGNPTPHSSTVVVEQRCSKSRIGPEKVLLVLLFCHSLANQLPAFCRIFEHMP